MTKQLSEDQVKHIAKLADLQLSEEEVQEFQKQLAETLDFIAHLNQIDTEKIPPTSQVSGNKNVFREDIVKPSQSQEETLANAKRKDKGYFVIEAIF